jgi:predicted phosphodiesterase
MRAVTFKREYKLGDVVNIFLASDLHLDSPEHDRELLIKEFDEAKRMNARIIIGGDIFDFLLNGDSKRYTPSRNSYGPIDSHINEAVRDAYEVLSPYASNIDVVMIGNHESSVIKYHSFDPVAMLVGMLNMNEKSNIVYLGYQGYIKYHYSYQSGGRTHTYVIKACHGVGGSSPVTKGTITLNRFMNMHEADLYFSGHTHSKVVLPCEPKSYIDRMGNVKVKERKAVVTGAYVKPVQEESTKRKNEPNPYNVHFGDLMRSLQSTGGVMLQHTFKAKDYMETKIIV